MAEIGFTTLSKLEQGKGNIALDSLEKFIDVLILIRGLIIVVLHK